MIENLTQWLSNTKVPYQSVELSKAFLVFLAFSVIGWISEVLYVGIFHEHKFVNRGFLHGPLCPIYGFGGIVMLSLPKCLQSPLWVLFLSGMFFCTVVEYIGSWALEKMFHTTWWDYSNHKVTIKNHTIPLNIKGRVCLLNSTMFGILAVLVIYFVQPLIQKVLSMIPDLYLNLARDIFGAILIVDLVASVHKLVDFSVYIARIKDFEENLKERFQNESWFKSASLSDMINSVKENVALHREKYSSNFLANLDYASRHHRIAESFMKHFPTMKSGTYKDSLALIKQKIKDSVEEHKAKMAQKKNSK